MRLRDPLALALALMALYAVVVVTVFALRLSGSAAGPEGGEAAVTIRPAAGTAQLIVERGETAEEIVAQLYERGVITDVRRFLTLLDYTDAAEELNAGCYVFPVGTPATEVIRRLREGETDEELLPLPEGLRLEEVGERVVDAGLATPAQWETALSGPRPEAILADRPEGAGLLGYLFPASYDLGCDDRPTADQLVAKMIATFAERVPPELVAEAETQGLSLHQLLTLAAVVEKEAILAEELPLIAAVFLNRLALGMALQADPTVQFAVASERGGAEGWWPALSLEDKELDSPYNTYVYPGLPPGPIANPGIEAIRAVAQPAETASLFFVATCDGTDRHAFAETLEQHNANVARCHDP